MIHITEFLKNASAQFNMTNFEKHAYDENECPVDKRHPFICQAKHIHCSTGHLPVNALCVCVCV